MSWHFSQALVEEYSVESFSDGKQFVQSRSKNIALNDSCRDRTKATLTHSQYGMTYEPSQDINGEIMLTWFRAASHAKTYPSQEKEQVLKANEADFGQKCLEWFAKYDPNSSSWKIPQLSLVEGLDVFSETWPRSGTMRNGTFSALTTSAPHTKEIGFGYWRTPTATECQRGLGKTMELMSLGKTHSENGRQIQVTLDAQARLYQCRETFPTPRAFMYKDSVTNRGKSNLGEVVGGKLNPDWVEWLMGWPIGWTDLNPLEMDKFQQWRRMHSKCCQKELEAGNECQSPK